MVTSIKKARKIANIESEFLVSTFVALKHLHKLIKKAEGDILTINNKKAKAEIKHIWKKLRGGFFGSEERTERSIARGYRYLIGTVSKLQQELPPEEIASINHLMSESGVFDSILLKLGSRGGDIEKALEECMNHPKNTQKLEIAENLIKEALESVQGFRGQMDALVEQLRIAEVTPRRQRQDNTQLPPGAQLLWDFNKFMNQDFKSIALGLTPSGHIHLGFLTTLACSFMYLKEHPGTHLIITNIENSLSSSVEKYNGVPLRFQYIEEGELLIPKDYGQLKKRNTAGYRVQGEITSLIWKLGHMFDKRTKKELKAIKKFVPPKDKKWLEEKEHKVFHFFGNQIYVYSFMRVLEKDRSFKKNIIKYITDIEFASTVSKMCGTTVNWRNFGNQVVIGGKRYQAKCFQVPIRLFCPNCYNICKEWAVVVHGHPNHAGPTLAAPCKNTLNKCPRALKQPGYDGFVYRSILEDLDMTEFHFMLDPMRDFFDPFKADCHIYGGDYFQLQNKDGVTGAQKVKEMFDFLEQKTGQKKYLFGGPLITMGGEKMSKSGKAFNIKDIKNIKKVFINAVEQLELTRTKSYPKGIQIEYTDIMKKVA